MQTDTNRQQLCVCVCVCVLIWSLLLHSVTQAKYPATEWEKTITQINFDNQMAKMQPFHNSYN